MRRRLVALALAAVAAVAGGAAVATEYVGPGTGEAAATEDGAAAAAATTPVLSARRVPTLVAAPVADRRLVAALDAVVARQPGTTCLTVSAGGRLLYGHNSDAPMTPASLEKLVTGVAALEVLGPDHRFRTRVVAARPPAGGVVAGDVWLVGGGDPLLATGDYARRFDYPQPFTSLEALADAVVAAGVRRIEGRVLGDESRYDRDRYPDPWPARFVPQDQSGPLSALTVNDGWAAYPPRPDVAEPDETPAEDPAAHAAAVFGLLLAQRGVQVTGGPGPGTAPQGAAELAAVESRPLAEIVGELLRHSDNQTGELLLKELAVASGRPGTTAEGAAVAAAVVARLGLPTAGTQIVDGSGLASENQLTCGLVQAILALPDWRSTIAAGLAVAGESGTLEHRFTGTPAEGALRAKTGTLNRTTALAGHLETPQDVELTFSFIANLPPDQVVDAEELALQDDLVAALARYPDGPALAALGPR